MSYAALPRVTIHDDHVGKHMLRMSTRPFAKIVPTRKQMLEEDSWGADGNQLSSRILRARTGGAIQSHHHILGYREAQDPWGHPFPQRGS